MLALGWVLLVVGIVVTPMPIPIPLIGILPMMAGLALLIHYSRSMRRIIQRVRHRVRWISYMLEHFAHRAPKKIARILHRSHPASIERHARIQSRPPSEIESKQ
jgi:hypothetical protein